MWTLVGAGIKTTKQSGMSQTDCIPKNTMWYKSYVKGLDPENNHVALSSGEKVVVHIFYLAF